MIHNPGMFALALVLTCGNLSAQQRYSDWTVSRQPYGYVASTVNDAGQEFGKLCYSETQNCLWAFTDIAKCADGNGETPALLATNEGAVHVTLHCIESDGVKLYSVSPYDSVQAAVASAGRVGIAIPMEDGLFKVVRFSLAGSGSATSTAERETTKLGSTSTQPLSL